MSKKENFRKETVKIGDLELSTKMTVGGLLYLQDKMGKIDKVDLDDGDMKKVVHLITALAISANPEADENELCRKVKAISVDHFGEIIDMLPGPEENPRQVRGNLVETKAPTGA